MTDLPHSSSGTQPYEGYIIDAENAAEMARLMIQDRVITHAMGGVLPEQPDLSGVRQVLDIGCGPGGWILSLTQQYPHIYGVGIDISHLMIEYATNLATSEGLTNARFQVMDATQPLHFPDQTFDLVNGRILTGFLSTQQWPALLSECARITKPGGILRLTETEWGFTNSAALDTLTGLCALGLHRAGHSFSPHGRTFGTTNVLRLLLRKAGYEAIEQRAHVVDFSTGTDAHVSNTQQVITVYKQLQPFYLQMQLATQAEIEQLCEQMETDVQAEDFCAIDYYLTIWGRKGESF
jgi:ubiquinone/menaquinone biosynthesis C-methylase UbiE